MALKMFIPLKKPINSGDYEADYRDSKMPIGLWGDENNRLTLDEIKERNIDHFAFIPPEGYVILDIDNNIELFEKIIVNVNQWQSKHPIKNALIYWPTRKGYHCLFKIPKQTFNDNYKSNAPYPNIFDARWDLKGNNGGMVMLSQLQKDYTYKLRLGTDILDEMVKVIENDLKLMELPLILQPFNKDKISKIDKSIFLTWDKGNNDETLRFDWIETIFSLLNNDENLVIELCLQLLYFHKDSEKNKKRWILSKINAYKKRCKQLNRPLDYKIQVVSENDNLNIMELINKYKINYIKNLNIHLFYEKNNISNDFWIYTNTWINLNKTYRTDPLVLANFKIFINKAKINKPYAAYNTLKSLNEKVKTSQNLLKITSDENEITTIKGEIALLIYVIDEVNKFINCKFSMTDMNDYFTLANGIYDYENEKYMYIPVFNNHYWDKENNKWEKHNGEIWSKFFLNVDYIAFDENKLEPVIMQWLLGMFETRARIDEFFMVISSVLCGNVNETWTILYQKNNQGHSGKSTIINMIENIIGHYSHPISLKDLFEGKEFSTRNFKGKTMLFSEEESIDASKNANDIIKKITGPSGSMIATNIKNSNEGKILLSQTIINNTNYTPTLSILNRMLLERIILYEVKTQPLPFDKIKYIKVYNKHYWHNTILMLLIKGWQDYCKEHSGQRNKIARHNDIDKVLLHNYITNKEWQFIIENRDKNTIELTELFNNSISFSNLGVKEIKNTKYWTLLYIQQRDYLIDIYDNIVKGNKVIDFNKDYTLPYE